MIIRKIAATWPVALFLLLVLAGACRRPSKRLASILTPIDKTKSLSVAIADYSQHLKAGDEVVAQGNDPSWSLTINPSKNQLLFKATNGISTSTTAPQRIADSDGSFRYDAPVESGRMKILFTPDSCVDKQSQQRFDYRVQVDIQGKSYMGCGVSLQQLALLQDIWVLTDLDGKRISSNNTQREPPRLELSLTEGRVTGTTGCNQLSGPVKADTRHILFGPLITTKIACAGEGGTLEGDLLSALNQPLTYRVSEGKLTLLRGTESVLVFKKVD